MTTVSPDDARVRIVYVSFALWLGSLMSDRRVKCVNLPREARVVRAMPCHDQMGRDAVLWLHSPDFDPVEDGAIIPEYRLEFELHTTETLIDDLASALRELLTWSQSEYQSNHAIDNRAKAVLARYETHAPVVTL